MPGTARWVLLALCTAVITLGVIETAAYATLQIARQRVPERFVPDWDAYVAQIDQKTMEYFNRHHFDPLLGWDYKPNFSHTFDHGTWSLSIASDGSRANSHYSSEGPIDIATYGDSFTFCDEVSDDQTWQYYLSEILDQNVANFGVGGYGPGQMLLKYERATWPDARLATVILAIYEGDLNRSLNRFRPFYDTNSKQHLGFKPRFVLGQGGRLQLIESPNKAPIQSQVQLRSLIDKARERDDWYERRVEIGFLYSWRALKLARLLRESAFGKPWRSPDTTALLRAIIDRFASVAQGRGHRPVLLFIPPVRSWHDGRRQPPYRSFVDTLRTERGDLLIIDLAEADFDASRFNVSPFSGHASPYGNQVIAHHVASHLASPDRTPASGSPLIGVTSPRGTSSGQP